MADMLLNIFVEGVLTKAFSLVNEEVSLILGVEEDLESLVQNLKMIQALLADAEQKSRSSRAVELWVRSLQTVASKADNVLDELGYVALAKKIRGRKHDKVRLFFSCSNPLIFRTRMAHKIKSINLSVDKVFQDANRIGLSPVQIATSFSIPTSETLSTDPFVDDSEVVGRTDSAEKIVSVLTSLEGEKNLSLVGIFGMPGLGKTTLAQLVYKDVKVRKHFDHKIWIHVSHNFNVERLLNEMVQSLTSTVSKLTNKEAVVRGLQGLLRAKRFLLVLDDVWNEDEELWNTMKRCLVEIGASTASRIVITTRKDSVVSTMQAFFRCPLGILSEDHSWELFEKIAFGPGGAIKCPELVNIGRKIVNKCGGVPLAIKTIGRLMYSRKEEQDWSKIEKSDVWNVFNADGNRVKSAIKLSFDNLPSLSLKQCFLHCFLYPKGSQFPCDDMIQLWMAQGLLNLSKEDGGAMEDLGLRYINILLHSSLLECGERDDYGNIIHCKMHDLIHDFVYEVAKDYSLVGFDNLPTDKREVTKKVLKKTFSDHRTIVLSHHLEVALPHCEDLRVLIVNDKKRQELPKPIGKLKHVRYLNITNTSITKFPNCISNLYYLQTLRLHSLQELPKNFCHLVSLRHLYIQQEGTSQDKNCLLPGIRVLTSLQTLPFFQVSQDGQCQISELGPLKYLKGNLKILALENVGGLEEARKAKISTKVNLESLELHWYGEFNYDDFFKFVELCLKIEGSTSENLIEEDRLKFLELQSKLEGVMSESYSDEDVLNGLEPHSTLKGLKIVNYRGQNLPTWMIVTSRPTILHNLMKVVLKNFIHCENMPPLGHLMHLKIANIEGMYSMGRDFYGWTNLDAANNPNVVAGASVVIFPALEELILKDMVILKEWSSVFNHDLLSHPAVKIFPSLVRLEVMRCPRLVSLPDDIWNHLTSLRKLSIVECYNLRNLPDGVGQLASLEILEIKLCVNLEYMPDIHGLKCMNEFSISGCIQLRSFPNGTEACTSINNLRISFCPKLLLGDYCQLPIIKLRVLEIGGGLSDDVDYFPWPFHTPFASLELLVLYGWPKLRSLPEQIQHLSTLRFFGIFGFEGIERLPEWLGSIGSLESLGIGNCEKLLYLPSAGAMQRLVNLKSLYIEQCPLLKERCNKDSNSEEWHKISHIMAL